MQPLDRRQASFSQDSICTGFINKPWKVVACAIGGVVFLALGAYVASLISLPTAFALTLGTAGVGYVFFKNRIEQKSTVSKDLKAELIGKIANDLKLAMQNEIDGKLVLFGYRIENDAKGSLTQRYESTPNIDKEEVIKEIQATLSGVESYTENSKIHIELLVVSALDQSLPETPTIDFQTYRNTYIGLQGNGKLGMKETAIFDQFLQDVAKGFNIIQVDRSKWNGDGTFA